MIGKEAEKRGVLTVKSGCTGVCVAMLQRVWTLVYAQLAPEFPYWLAVVVQPGNDSGASTQHPTPSFSITGFSPTQGT